MNLINALNWRYAVREFSSETIAPQQLQQLLDATRLSASSYGLQPYHLLVIQSPVIKEQLIEFSLGQDKVSNCSQLIVFAAHTNIGDATVNRYIKQFSQTRGVEVSQLANMQAHYKAALAVMDKNQRQQWAHQQAYIALGNFLTCAALMQIDTCPITGIEFDGYDKVLGLREKNLTTTAVCPIGIRHPQDASAHEKKVRFDAHDMVSLL
ncbi:MAG: NAD(P)H-dependent oxidoreductase [Cellvibrio sp.]|uniref:NAD(P)H-dependent oxidoreductase n=1 Tax=Cellvibrio sp. TaxID=1965322 RepID=UPI0031A77D16